MKYLKIPVEKKYESYVVIAIPDDYVEDVNGEMKIHKRACELAQDIHDFDWEDEDIDADFRWEELQEGDPDISIAEPLE